MIPAISPMTGNATEAVLNTVDHRDEGVLCFTFRAVGVAGVRRPLEYLYGLGTGILLFCTVLFEVGFSLLIVLSFILFLYKSFDIDDTNDNGTFFVLPKIEDKSVLVESTSRSCIVAVGGLLPPILNFEVSVVNGSLGLTTVV